MRHAFLAGGLLALGVLCGCAGSLPNPNPPVPALLPDPQSLPCLLYTSPSPRDRG